MSRVFFARSLTKGLAMGGILVEAGPSDFLPSLMRYGTDMMTVGEQNVEKNRGSEVELKDETK
jgi:hypothetical protein